MCSIDNFRDGQVTDEGVTSHMAAPSETALLSQVGLNLDRKLKEGDLVDKI